MAGAKFMMIWRLWLKIQFHVGIRFIFFAILKQRSAQQVKTNRKRNKMALEVIMPKAGVDMTEGPMNKKADEFNK